MLYTKQGDNGQTKFFGCDQSFSKSSRVAEALGALDEINSFLGICKIQVLKENLQIDTGEGTETLAEILSAVQQDLFLVQAEVGGADKRIPVERVVRLENIIAVIEPKLPKITSFIVAGGTEVSAVLDYARSIARRAERRVVAVGDEKTQVINSDTFAYLNRLSSLLYALARYANSQLGIEEEKPRY